MSKNDDGKIDNWKTFMENHWEWDWLRGCFGDTKIMPTDVDGLVERNGYFLFIETKLPGKEMDTGQRLALTRLCDALGERGALLVIWGKKDSPEAARLYYRGYTSEWKHADRDRVRRIVDRWFVNAENGARQ